VIEYVGELVTAKQFRKRSEVYAVENVKHHYFMQLESDVLIDATKRGMKSVHSCHPGRQ